MYKHTQIGTVMLVSIGAALLLAVVLYFSVPPEGRETAYISIGAVALILLLFAGLTAEVDSREIRLRFGPGLIRRTIPMERVASVEAVRTKWWYGFGIRMTPQGWMWNVSGLKAVKLNYRDGRSFLIGTDDPRGLSGAIQRHLRP